MSDGSTEPGDGGARYRADDDSMLEQPTGAERAYGAEASQMTPVDRPEPSARRGSDPTVDPEGMRGADAPPGGRRGRR